MRYQTDYVLRLIEQLGGLIREALEKLGMKDAEEPCQLAGEAIGLALDMDPVLAADLSPQSLLSLLRLGSLDDRVITLVQQAIEVEAAALGNRGDVIAAGFRREQADAVRSLLHGNAQTIA